MHVGAHTGLGALDGVLCMHVRATQAKGDQTKQS